MIVRKGQQTNEGYSSVAFESAWLTGDTDALSMKLWGSRGQRPEPEVTAL